MEESKFIKGKCGKTGLYFGMDVKMIGSAWKVVNMIRLSEEEAKLTTSEVKQDHFITHTNLLACPSCGNREVGGCNCVKYNKQCSRSMKYRFNCIYCKEFEIDYSLPTGGDITNYKGGTVKLSQGKEVKIITFSNVKWEKFDKVKFHRPGRPEFQEPKKHVVADQKNIEFHGYNISQMDEGVYYIINEQDDFSIECDVDTSTISPHPGGFLYISFGIITARIDQNGGSFLLDEKSIATVGSKFHMALSLIDSVYKVVIDGKTCGEKSKEIQGNKRVVFGFQHEAHYCSSLSHAYLKDIQMQHGVFHDKKQ